MNFSDIIDFIGEHCNLPIILVIALAAIALGVTPFIKPVITEYMQVIEDNKEIVDELKDGRAELETAYKEVVDNLK